MAAMFSKPDITQTPSPLFRREALEARTALRQGRPVALAPLSWAALCAALLVMATCAGVFVATANYARKETALGVLKSVGGERRVMAPGLGALRSLAVREGDVVAKGAILAVIAAERRFTSGEIVDGEVSEALAAEEAFLTERLKAAASAAPLQVLEVDSQIAALVADKTQAVAQAAFAKERLALAEKRVSSAVPLIDRGLMASEEMRRREDAVIAQRQALSQAEGRIANLEAQQRQLSARRARLVFDQAQERAGLQHQLASLAAKKAQAEAARGFAIAAPMAGRVTGLQAGIGAPIDPSTPLLTLTPIGAPLVAELFVPSRAIGFVREGQRVRLLYEAFPYQRFGPAFGVVQSVSATVLAPREVQALVRVEEPVYRAIVRLDRQSMEAFGKEAALQPGMALRADIILEERSLLDWLLEPLYAARGRMEMGP